MFPLSQLSKKMGAQESPRISGLGIQQQDLLRSNKRRFVLHG